MKQESNSPVGQLSRRSALAGFGAAGALAAMTSFGQAAQRGDDQEMLAFNIRRFGAKGDGKADDTAAIQAAVDALLKAKGGRLHLPAGRYRVTRSIRFTSAERVLISGDGHASILLHENDEPALLWPEGVCLECCTLRDFAIASSRQPKSATVPAIACRGGSRLNLFGNLLLEEGDAAMGGGVEIGNGIDTVAFEQCIFWRLRGTGIQIGNGCEVRIFGGRFLAARGEGNQLVPTSIGVSVTNDNGGVHIVTTDFSLFDTAVRMGSPGGKRTRELFLTHATLDSGRIGLHIVDAALVSMAGCWSVSNDEAQILMEGATPVWAPGPGALLTIAGGTIGNAGVFGRPGGGHGMVARAGSFTVNGVLFAYNKGTGLLVENDAVKNYAVTGCRFNNNSVAAELRGNGYAVTGNVLTANKANIDDHGGPAKNVSGNVIA